MELKFGRYSLYFGRRLNEPNRQTEQTYYNILPFLSVAKYKTKIPKKNASRLRYFSENSVVRLVINMIKDGVLKQKWRIIPVNAEDIGNFDNEIKIISNIIKSPNKDDDYESFWGAVLEDSLVGDCMCFEKALSGNPNKPLFLFPIDGLTMCMVINSDYKYSQDIGGKTKYFTADEIAYVKRQNRTYSPFGLSPLEVSWDYINSLTNAFEYASEVASNAVPKYMVNIGKDLSNKIDEFKTYFYNECMGEANIPILATDKIESAQIAPISEDALFMKWQTFVATFISHEFGVPSQFIGLEKSSDRSTFQEKYEQYVENALKPYAELIAKAINIHVIKTLGLQDKIKFEFIWEDTMEQKKQKTDMAVKKCSLDLITLNEARLELGRTPIDDEYGDLRMSEYKAKLNEKYAVNGFKGVGGDGYADTVTDNKLNDTKYKNE